MRKRIPCLPEIIATEQKHGTTIQHQSQCGAKQATSALAHPHASSAGTPGYKAEVGVEAIWLRTTVELREAERPAGLPWVLLPLLRAFRSFSIGRGAARSRPPGRASWEVPRDRLHLPRVPRREPARLGHDRRSER
jgi:hypothetical protein